MDHQDRLTELLRDLPPPEPPGDLRRRVMSALDGRRRAGLPRLALAGAAVAVVALVAWPSGPPLRTVGDELHPDSFRQQHALVAAADPLADAAALQALGTLALRAAEATP